MTRATTIRGIGLDTVHLPGFRHQLADAASRFVAMTFTPAERAVAEARPGTDPSRHLAARFAAKEAFIKAWSSALWGRAPVLEQVDMRAIEVVCDAWDRPRLVVHGEVASALQASVPDATLHLSLSHDGDQALAMVTLVAPPAEKEP